ncbi:MAG: 50S ribosomal protein L13 [Anaerolineae bacterium SM23_ 63]|nr:MAG: 50S ribosomal protein L13 [Anaerolineae bacterium SM23_ 63]HEY45857.1 50S ribosomal protein L13 [Anaerolineae bacterium]
MQKTYYPKPGEVTHDWYVIDAADQNLGRFATQVARLLLGKNKPQFTPGVDIGDFVVIVNAKKIAVTGKKLDDKFYYRHSGYPGGIKQISLRDQLGRFPERVIRAAVWGMLPHNRYGRKLMKKLKIYAGPDHPHAAQKPQQFVLEADRQSD